MFSAEIKVNSGYFIVVQALCVPGLVLVRSPVALLAFHKVSLSVTLPEFVHISEWVGFGIRETVAKWKSEKR